MDDLRSNVKHIKQKWGEKNETFMELGFLSDFDENGKRLCLRLRFFKIVDCLNFVEVLFLERKKCGEHSISMIRTIFLQSSLSLCVSKLLMFSVFVGSSISLFAVVAGWYFFSSICKNFCFFFHSFTVYHTKLQIAHDFLQGKQEKCVSVFFVYPPSKNGKKY